MRKGILNLGLIKDRILSIKGKAVDITINHGRKKINNYSGIVENIYPSVFTIKILDNERVKSVTCSYSDVLCGDVKIDEKSAT